MIFTLEYHNAKQISIIDFAGTEKYMDFVLNWNTGVKKATLWSNDGDKIGMTWKQH